MSEPVTPFAPKPACSASASFLAASLLLLAGSTPASAARAPITGKLSKRGYTLIALAANGKARTVRVRANGFFRVRPPGDRVTLHLRGRKGKYAGPIVVGGTATRVVVGVRAGARLGAIKVRHGYAKVVRRLSDHYRDPTRIARARHGVPIGAGRYGRVRSRLPRASSAAASGAGGDRDLDGIPGALDIDDDGDLLLDNFDRPTTARAAQTDPGAPLYLGSQLSNLRLDQTVNANARPPGSPLTVPDVDAALSTYGRLDMDVPFRGTTELDCGRPQSRTDPTLGGLVYCTRGGTGMAENKAFPGPAGGPFDADGDGLGEIGSNTCPLNEDCVTGFQFQHHAKTAQIGTGDLLIQRATVGGVAQEVPATLQLVFATVPALVSYSDTAGHSATISYPVPDGGPGTPGNGLPVKAGPNGDMIVTLKLWRPQRLPIPPETAPFIDLGHLNHTAGLNCVDALPGDEKCALKHCPPGAFTEKDPNLSRTTLPDTQGAVFDASADQPAKPSNTLTYTLNLSDCIRDPRGYGVKTKPIPWPVGQEREFFFMAWNLLDVAQQLVYFKRL